MPIKILENISLANYTTFRIGGPARYFAVAQNKDELAEAIRWAKEKNRPFFVLGGGSNFLVSDEGFGGLAIKMENTDIKIENDNEKCKIGCGAGTPFSRVIIETAKSGYSGAEWGFGIPGTIGGAICGNAGRLGQDISQIVESVKILDAEFNEKELSNKECEFAYRESRFKKTGEIILEAVLFFVKKEQAAINEVLNQAKEVVKQSPPFPSAGCAFKNYKLKPDDILLEKHPELSGRARDGKIGVGFLIDQCGLKGKQIGGAKIWEGHANYIINAGGAKAADVLALIKLAKEAVKEKYGIGLEEEIRIL
ncbi:MAG: UDP-N-acetylmuramate dehydrogenase [Candidatus Portnoybacteria bacterium]|nr:UDP-N-acetylmuramate dehydrogenase [Candidatus Portnoybacteria bacterium]